MTEINKSEHHILKYKEERQGALYGVHFYVKDGTVRLQIHWPNAEKGTPEDISAFAQIFASLNSPKLNSVLSTVACDYGEIVGDEEFAVKLCDLISTYMPEPDPLEQIWGDEPVPAITPLAFMGIDRGMFGGDDE
jgi:hypothetical protein